MPNISDYLMMCVGHCCSVIDNVVMLRQFGVTVLPFPVKGIILTRSGVKMGEYTLSLNKRVTTFGADIGYCAICRKYSKLTQDHVPPKGCGNIRHVILQTLHQHMAKSNKKRDSQSGVRFKTLCSECNNNFLGSRYDPALIEFYTAVYDLGNKVRDNKAYLPRNFFFVVNTQRLVRSVVGHLLAAHAVIFLSNGDQLPPFYNSLAEYFLDEKKGFPEDVAIYYWFYPYRNFKVVKGAAVMSSSWQGHIAGDIIKFFPVAFWFVYHNPKGVDIPCRQLLLDKNLDIDASEEYQLSLTGIPHANYPEMPSDDGIVLFSGDACSVACPK